MQRLCIFVRGGDLYVRFGSKADIRLTNPDDLHPLGEACHREPLQRDIGMVQKRTFGLSIVVMHPGRRLY